MTRHSAPKLIPLVMGVAFCVLAASRLVPGIANGEVYAKYRSNSGRSISYRAEPQRFAIEMGFLTLIFCGGLLAVAVSLMAPEVRD